VVINDIKEPDPDTLSITGIPKNFSVNMLSYNNYFMYGALMPGRNYQGALGFRFGWNNQEKVDEISGSGKHYTAEFWEYNPWTVHRWNMDPVFRMYPGWSPYAINFGNPVVFNDPEGDCPPGVDCGDVVKHPEIAPQVISGIKGGMFGDTRSGGKQFHGGVDILAPKGTRLRSLMAGKVVGMRNSFKPGEYKEDSFGNFVIVRTQLLDGSFVDIKYAHLDKVYPRMGDHIQKGKIIGQAGNTGNPGFQDPDKTSSVDMNPAIPVENFHVHIMATIRDGGTEKKVDPIPFMKTQFFGTGEPIPDEEHRVTSNPETMQFLLRQSGNKANNSNSGATNDDQ